MFATHASGVGGAATTSAATKNPFSDPRLLSPPRRPAAVATRSPQQDDDGAADHLLAHLLGAGHEANLQRMSLNANVAAPAAAAAVPFARLSISPHSARALAHSAAIASSAVDSASLAVASSSLYYLFKFAREGDVSAVRKMLSSPSPALDVNASDSDGDTALHRACAGGHLDLAHMLVVEFGADIHARNARGETPMLVNARNAAARNAQLLLFLVHCGADVHQANSVSDKNVSTNADPRNRKRNTHFLSPFFLLTSAACLQSGLSTLQLCSSGGALPFSASSHSPASLASLSFGTGQTGASHADLPSQLLAAHAQPVRHFVLRQASLLAQSREQLQVAAAQRAELDRLRASHASLSAHLQSTQSALQGVAYKLAQLDAALDRSAAEQIAQAQAQAQSQSQSQSSSASANPPPPLPRPHVFVSEVRSALQSIRQAATTQSAAAAATSPLVHAP